jgi:hypothetical protein
MPPKKKKPDGDDYHIVKGYKHVKEIASGVQLVCAVVDFICSSMPVSDGERTFLQWQRTCATGVIMFEESWSTLTRPPPVFKKEADLVSWIQTSCSAPPEAKAYWREVMDKTKNGNHDVQIVCACVDFLCSDAVPRLPERFRTSLQEKKAQVPSHLVDSLVFQSAEDLLLWLKQSSGGSAETVQYWYDEVDILADKYK